MKRFAEQHLTSWIGKPRRKPLIIRGARQVGKSTLVRNFARENQRRLIEVNLEKNPGLDSVFKSNDIPKIIAEVEGLTGIPVRDEGSLLFLDEIQAVPSVLPALRYFFEERPDLPLIAAGSLLEFILEKHDFSMPVGRIEYLHLGPMTFKEFLTALGEEDLLAYFEIKEGAFRIPETAHQRLLRRQREFLFVGGLPEAVLAFQESRSLLAAREVHRSVIQTYQDDFAKYSKRMPLSRLHRIFNALPRHIGEKIKYSQVSPEDRHTEVKAVIELLIKARLYLPAFHSDCSGLPLQAGVDEKIYKLYFLDVGLLNYLNGLDWRTLESLGERGLINEGKLAEQFAAQHLACREGGLEPPDLFYWLREGRRVNAEVDFVVSAGKRILPMEVKAGKSGSLKSLLQFVLSKKGATACRFDLNLPSRQTVVHHLRQREGSREVRFTLLSLPLYLVEEVTQISF